MKQTLKLLLLTTISLFTFYSCSSDDNNDDDISPSGNYANGVFILNEGGSGLSTASISFLKSNNTIENDIYRTENPDAQEIGTYLQSMFFKEDKAFIISGSANKITVVDRYTFKYIASIETDFQNPRYGFATTNKAYVTNTAADFMSGADDYLTEIDLTTYKTTKIPAGKYVDKIIAKNEKLYISSGSFGNGNSILVYNTLSNTFETEIDLGVGNSPNSLKEINGFLYILTQNASSNSKIFTINLLDNKASHVDIPTSVGQANNLVIDNNRFYFTAGEKVYATAINANIVSDNPIFSYPSESQFGSMYGFEVRNDKFYIADATDFASNGKVYIYNEKGILLSTHSVEGIGPNGFYFGFGKFR